MWPVLPQKIAARALEHYPKLMARPLSLLPFCVKESIIKRLLTLLLTTQKNDGELSFLMDKWVGIHIKDLQLDFEVGFDGDWQVRPFTQPMVTFSANSDSLLLIAAAVEDPDTLFFQRKLAIEGDTQLGLEVKNLLLDIDYDTLPSLLGFGLNKLAGILQSQHEKTSA